MALENQENEVKFLLKNPGAFESRLAGMGAKLQHARVFECNLRFDLPNGELTKTHQVLRLRKDDRAHMTYKGPARPDQPVSIRQEIEVEVSDFNKARLFLQALGYLVSVQYEKWRTTYQMANVEIDLDELPFGSFCELEGPDAGSIQSVAEGLNLDWNARILESYLAIFARVIKSKNLPVKNLAFSEFRDFPLSAKDLGLQPADHL
jgi:adenylate cyclase class 2